MAFEMICGQCRGNLLVEHFGVIVACPHCGAHLRVPAPEGSAPAASVPESVPVPTPAPQPISATADVSSSSAPIAEEIPASAPIESDPFLLAAEGPPPPPSQVEISVVSPVAMTEPQVAPAESITEEAPAAVTGEGSFSLSSLLAAASADSTTIESAPGTEASDSVAASEPVLEVRVPSPVAADSIEPTEFVIPSDPPTTLTPTTEALLTSELTAAAPPDLGSSGLSGLLGTSASTTPAAEAAAAVAESSMPSAADTSLASAWTADERTEDSSLIEEASLVAAATSSIKPARKDYVTVSKATFLILLSYASAMTLGFGWAVYQLTMRASDVGGGLEALPDPVPPSKSKNKKTTGTGIYAPNTVMTPGHDLRIGDTQRFGNIKVTVLKVTRGPIQFRHFSNAQKTHLPSSPVLKLWLRFENVSDNQEIAPLDDYLLFHRLGSNRHSYLSNQFVCRADQWGKKDGKRVIAFDHVVGKEWDLADLLLDKPLAPHESRDYYVPTCENDLDELTGDLVWRVHIRKGYSARGNGVTTLFEVHFKSDVIRDEPA